MGDILEEILGFRYLPSPEWNVEEIRGILDREGLAATFRDEFLAVFPAVQAPAVEPTLERVIRLLEVSGRGRFGPRPNAVVMHPDDFEDLLRIMGSPRPWFSDPGDSVETMHLFGLVVRVDREVPRGECRLVTFSEFLPEAEYPF